MKRVVVTGASRGIGFDLCRLLVRAGGYEVVGTSRSWPGEALEELRALAAGTQSGGGQRSSSFSGLTLDNSSADSRLRFPLALSRVLRNSKLHALVNNAAVYPQPTSAWDAETFRNVMETNAVGPLRLAMDLHQFAADDFHVVNVTSGLGRLALLGAPYRAAVEACHSVGDLAALPFVEGYGAGASSPAPLYALSKAALNRGTRVLADAWGSSARVSSVDPGWCSTSMGGPSAPRSSRDGALSLLAIILGNSGGSGNVFSCKGGKVDP